MEQDLLLQRISRYAGLTETEKKFIISNFKEIELPKKKVILKKGEIAHEAYYVVRGCLRVYYKKEGVDISAYFFTEDMFTNACESFIDQKPSRHYMEAAEDSIVLIITHKALEGIYRSIPAANVFFRKMMEERFAAIHHAFTTQILDTPEERYIELQKNNSSLLNRIPQHQIATYLGITPISLSRIRNRLRK